MVEQLAKNARSLLLAHGALAVFVIGIYGKTVRLARFDHSCAVVSTPFDLKTCPRTLRKFFWHFVNPIDTTIPVVGADPTSRALTIPEQNWIRDYLKRTGIPVPPDLSRGRRALVYEREDSDITRVYFLFRLIDRDFVFPTTSWPYPSTSNTLLLFRLSLFLTT